jgi:uncharacterized protein (DUF2062 family)
VSSLGRRWQSFLAFFSTKPLRELLYRLRTEGGSPRQLALSVALGVFIGCLPLYGIHLLLCFFFARLFRLNRLLTYLASHISFPALLPLLLVAEVHVGRTLRGAPSLALDPIDLHHLDWRALGVDLAVGSPIVGSALAALFGAATYWASRRRRKHPAEAALLEEAARRYLDTGLFHWEFVRGKLHYDPLYFHLLRDGLLPVDGRLLDLGCGRGILFALLDAAHVQADRGLYPEGWPPAPHLALHGIESRPKTAAAARHALDGTALIETADLCSAPLPACDCLLLLDVLHYLPAPDQERLLARAGAALAADGTLLMRETDAAAGWRFVATRLQERISALFRGQLRLRFHYRTAAEWRRLLEALGFAVAVEPLWRGTPYGNVLLIGRRPKI